jgi:predicted Zn-dependent peptidase
MTHAVAHIEAAPIIRRLSNGLTVAMEKLPYLRTVAAGIWIRAGSVNESAEEAGISHFLEHLFFKGTTTRTALQIVEPIERRGGQMNAFTSRDYTCLYVKVLDTQVTTAIEILCDMLKNSQWFDLEKERNVILEEIASSEDVPEDYAHDRFVSKTWPGHSLGRPIAGFTETVSSLDKARIQRYFETWYRPENMIVSVAGNFDEEEVFAQIASELEGMSGANPKQPTTPPAFSTGAEYVERDIAQSHVCFGFPAPPACHAERYAFDVLSSALGGGSTSRLFQRVREEQGLAYSIYAYVSSHFLTGILGFYAAVAPENMGLALDLCTKEIRGIRDGDMSADELDLNREQLKGNMFMALENTFNRMSRLAKCLMYYGRVLPVDEIITKVDAVSLEDIRAISEKTFRPDNASLVVLGPHVAGRPEALAL